MSPNPLISRGISAHQTILVVEDSPEDFETMMRALRKSKLSNPIQHCTDGDEALDYLFRRGAFSPPEKAPRPSIVLLDLNLPGTDGREVLHEIKSDADLRKIPVVILTTSADQHDIERCYSDGANSYVQKPVDLRGFMLAIERLKEYWFEIVVFPVDG